MVQFNSQNAGMLALLSGLGILSGNRPGVGATQAIGQGGLTGLNAFSQLQQGDRRQRLEELEIAEAERRAEEQRKRGLAFENLMRQGRPQQAPLQAGPLTPVSTVATPAATPSAAPRFTPEQTNFLRTLPTDDALNIVGKQVFQEPKTPIGKARADFRAGVLTADELEDEIARIGNEDNKLQFDNANDLRDEFVKQSNAFVTTRDAFARIQASAEDPSPAGDLALIFNYMKVLDPASVVRESEFQEAAAAGSLPQRVQAAFNRISVGEKLSNEQRNDFVDRANRLFRSQLKLQEQLRTQFTGLSERFGVPVENVVLDLRGDLVGQETVPTPAPGPEIETADFSTMSGIALKQTVTQAGGLAAFSPEQREAISKRLSELGFD